MRKILALGCCVFSLAFGFVAGAAHVHESADHHEEPRGLHLDHVHLGDSAGREQERQSRHESPHDGDARLDPWHVDHHDGDVLYLSATAIRSIDSSLRLMPTTVSMGATIDPSSAMSDRDDAMPGQPRDPPRKSRTRPRAPPA